MTERVRDGERGLVGVEGLELMVMSKTVGETLESSRTDLCCI